MPYPFVTAADVEHRLSPEVVRRLLDDYNTGIADENALNRLIKDSSGKVAGVLRANYPLDTIKAMTAEQMPEEIRRLTLDGVVMYAAQRHPECVHRDWVELKKAWDADLKMLRNGDARLDVEGSPEPPANVGGDISVGDPDEQTETTARPYFLWGTGDF